MSRSPDPYVHGHHESVLRSHAQRTVDNSARYLEPHLASGLVVLDLGCGPGTITVELAERVAPGPVVGIDASAEALDTAEARVARSPATTCWLVRGDVHALSLPDASVDVAHAHQLLQHLRDPIAALTEMRRVLRPGGVVAVRDADYGAMAWSPPDPLLDRWLDLYHQITMRRGVQPDAGRHLAGWVREAGFTSVEASTSCWTFATADRRAWWGESWAERVTASAYAQHAVELELAGPEELEAIAGAFRRWARCDRGVFVVPHGEIVARRP